MRILVLSICLGTLMGISFEIQAEIRETHTFASVLADTQPGTLILCDLDNTVIAPIDYESTPLYNSMTIEWMKPVETFIPKLIRLLQQQTNVYIVALTARPKFLSSFTLHYLEKSGISFAKSSAFPDGMITDEALYANVLIKDGVVFAGPRNDKGVVADILLKSFDTSKINRIIFIDNTRRRVEQLERALSDWSGSFIGYVDHAREFIEILEK